MPGPKQARDDNDGCEAAQHEQDAIEFHAGALQGGSLVLKIDRAPIILFARLATLKSVSPWADELREVVDVQEINENNIPEHIETPL